MTFVVPFDGSDLAEAALGRAIEFAAVLDEPVVAVVVVPTENRAYARERGWIAEDEPFEPKTVVSRLREQVLEVDPEAAFDHVVVDEYATSGTIASRIRRFARGVDASMVFVGSENAGRVVSGIGSVGATVAGEPTYDVVIVRNPGPARVDRLRKAASERPTDADRR